MLIPIAGTSFSRFPVKKGDAVTIKHEPDNKYTSGDEQAYAVMLEGHKLGYIPSVITNKKKMIDAKRDGKQGEFNRLWEMGNILVYMRDCIYTDFNRNHITPLGTVFSVKWMEMDGSWVGTETDGNVSIVVDFDYE